MRVQVLCRIGNGNYLSFDVPEGGEAVVGREPGLAVTLPLEGVSRRHARIACEGSDYFIEDLKSTNGTFVNGGSVTGETKERLRHLDVIGLGKGIELLFVIREKTALSVQRGIVSAMLRSDDGEGTVYEIATGEITMGRSLASNVVVDSRAVSKLHARIQRSLDQLVLQDLSSANGTYVNGARVMTALLQHGDSLSLAGVASYRVHIEWGDIASPAAAPTMFPKASLVAAPSDAPEFSAEWKTRYEWDSGERAVFEDLRRLAEQGAVQKTTPVPRARSGKTGKTPVVTPPPKSPEIPAAPPKEAAPPPPPPAPVSLGPIHEVRLSGSGVELVVTNPGSYEIGRADEVPLRVVHATVSRRQARLVLMEDRKGVLLEQVGTTHPTVVNGAPLEGARPLADGDRVSFGEVNVTVSFKR
jgi:pSer/pThr/pTyr-binding forkhead associated (FHA) protein